MSSLNILDDYSFLRRFPQLQIFPVSLEGSPHDTNEGSFSSASGARSDGSGLRFLRILPTDTNAGKSPTDVHSDEECPPIQAHKGRQAEPVRRMEYVTLCTGGPSDRLCFLVSDHAHHVRQMLLGLLIVRINGHHSAQERDGLLQTSSFGENSGENVR